MVDRKRRVERAHVLEQRRIELQPAIDQQLGGFRAEGFAARFGGGAHHVDALFAARGLPGDVKPLRDQLALDLIKPRGQRRHVAAIEVQRFGLLGNQFGQEQGLLVARRQRTPALDRGLEIGEALVDARAGEGGGEIAHQRRTRTALGEHAFRRVVRGVEIDIRQIADHPVRPALRGQAGLLAGHEFKAAMRAKVQHGVGLEVLAQPAIERGESVARGEAPLEQQPHRIAFDADRGLDAYEHIAKLRAEDLNRAAVRLQLTGRRAPRSLDVLEPGLARHDGVGHDPRVDIGLGAIARRIANQDRRAQRIDAFRHFDGVAFARQPLERGVERFEHAEELRGASRAGIGREIEQHDRNAALRCRRAGQIDLLHYARGERFGAFGAAFHLPHACNAGSGKRAAIGAAGAGLAAAVRTAAENHRLDGPIKLGNRDHHRRFQRQQPLRVRAPGLKCLEFHRMRGDIGPVKLGEDRLGRCRIVVGRAADKAEARQVHHGIDRALAVLHEQRLDRRPPIKTAGKGRDHAQAPGLHRRDHAVIMARILGEHIGAQHEEADRTALARSGAGGQGRSTRRHARGHRRVIDADFGIFARRFGLHRAAQGGTLAGSIAVDQRADHVHHVVVAAREPVLQGQEIGAHVLRGARHEAQQLGQAAQHGHLTLARACPRLARSAQLLEQAHHARGGLVHSVVTHAGELDHFARRHQADDCIAIVAAGFERRHHRADMILEEQHRAQDDVGLRDVCPRGVERTGLLFPVCRRMETDRHTGPGAGKLALPRWNAPEGGCRA